MKRVQKNRNGANGLPKPGIAAAVSVLICSILAKLWMCLFNRHLGKYIQSTTLLATSADSRNDAISTSAVLLAGVLGTAFGWKIDGWMGLAVAIFILYSGIECRCQHGAV